MIKQYNFYMMKLLAWPTLLVTLCLTSIIWLTQALRYIDFIVNRGLSVMDFLQLAMLLVPSLLMLILPVAFFVGTLFSYNKLTADSELVVMKAAGISPWQLARPAVIIGLIVTAMVYATSLYLLPASKRQFKDMQSFLKDNYSSVLLQEEVFSSPVDGLTVFIRKRDKIGNLEGILVYDSRTGEQSSTLMAEKGKLVQSPSGPKFYLVNGLRQERAKNGQMTWLNFDSYSLDIAFYTAKKNGRRYGADELYINEIFSDTLTSNPNVRRDAQVSKYRAHGHQRITWPIVTLGLGLLAATTLLRGSFSRRSNWKHIAYTSAIAIAVILALFGSVSVVGKQPALVPILYILSFGLSGICCYLLIKDANMAPPANAKPLEKPEPIAPVTIAGGSA